VISFNKTTLRKRQQVSLTMGNTLVLISDVLRQPTKKTERAAGYDLRATDAFEVGPFDKSIVSTGVRVAIPHNFYGQICDKSSFSSKTGLIVAAGVVDSDYTGELKVLLFNPSPVTKVVPRDSVIAQIVIIPLFRGEVVHMEPQAATSWSRPTARGNSGFGVSDTSQLDNGATNRRRS
jgi:dUTP pyrophosphatase